MATGKLYNIGYVSSASISGGATNPFVMTPTTSEPAKSIGRLWMSGSSTYCRLMMISGNGASAKWQQFDLTAL